MRLDPHKPRRCAPQSIAPRANYRVFADRDPPGFVLVDIDANMQRVDLSDGHQRILTSGQRGSGCKFSGARAHLKHLPGDRRAHRAAGKIDPRTLKLGESTADLGALQRHLSAGVRHRTLAVHHF